SLYFCVFFFLLAHRRQPLAFLFPYTTLFRSIPHSVIPPSISGAQLRAGLLLSRGSAPLGRLRGWLDAALDLVFPPRCAGCGRVEDRKSTRLNSSHVKISYAAFVLKKKSTVFS